MTNVVTKMFYYTVRWFSRPWCKAENRGTRPKSKSHFCHNISQQLLG